MTWSKAAAHLTNVAEAGMRAGWTKERIAQALNDAIAAANYSPAEITDALNSVTAYLDQR